MLTGAELIAREREHQLTKWSSAHDENYRDGTLAVVAATLAAHGTGATVEDKDGRGSDGDCWGLVAKCKNNDIKRLSIAGALIAAEIDRLLAIHSNHPA